MMQIDTQINNLQGAEILNSAVDNTNATIGIQINKLEHKQKELIKVKIFYSGKIVKINEEALDMSKYNKDSELSKGTVTHQGFRVDIDKIDIGKRDTEKLKMELTMEEERLVQIDSKYPYVLACIIDE